MDRRILRRLAELGHGRRDRRRISLLADCLHGAWIGQGRWSGGAVGQWSSYTSWATVCAQAQWHIGRERITDKILINSERGILSNELADVAVRMRVCAQASHLEADRPGQIVCIFMPHARHECDFIYGIHIQMATFKLPYDRVSIVSVKYPKRSETFYSAQSLRLCLSVRSVCASRLIPRKANKWAQSVERQGQGGAADFTFPRSQSSPLGLILGKSDTTAHSRFLWAWTALNTCLKLWYVGRLRSTKASCCSSNSELLILIYNHSKKTETH